MAAKLKWNDNDLMLGPFILVSARRVAGSEWIVSMPLTVGDIRDKSLPRVKQSCESEVRRLLKEVGVEVEP